jgi:nitrite reductase/ring-hydroxylating ferredoxin subunit
LQCTSHFAQFRMHDGLCVYGPCAGKSLYRLQLTIKDGSIYLLQAV